MNSENPSLSPAALAEKILAVESGLNRIILGKAPLVRQFLVGLLARGHVLLEGLPGLGKTQLVRAFCELCGLLGKRIQFTPDLMPLDITGSYILSERDGRRDFEFHPGPLFAHLILADEINRASPKTQSALLEAMQERRLTVLGHTHTLPEPFLVMATQNPIEMEGTYPLPEAQLDRFLFKLAVGDVPAEVLAELLIERGRGELPPLSPILTREEFLQAQAAVEAVQLSKPVAAYIARLVKATHADSGLAAARHVKHGASPRAALAIAMAARARAFLTGRDTAGFEDVKDVARPALRHRIILDYSARLESVTADAVVEELMTEVPELDKKTPPGIVETLV